MNMMDFLHSEGNKYSFAPNEIANFSSQKISDAESLENASLNENIQIVRLNSNHLTKLPVKALKECPNLKYLDISKNKIETLEGINEIENLVLVDVSKNLLVELKGIEDNQRLKRVLASKNKILEVHLERELPSLILLDLHNNALSSLHFGHFCPNLTELYVDACQLTTMSHVTDFPSLQHLTASHNMICDEAEIASASLSNVDISWNRISSIQPFMRMTSLVYLNVEGNPLTDAGLVSNLTLPTLRCFKFGHTQITRLGQLLVLFPNIEMVDARHSLLSSMDDIISFVSGANKLKFLDTRFTPLTEGLYIEDGNDQEQIWESICDFETQNQGNREERRVYRLKIIRNCIGSMEVLDNIKIYADTEYVDSDGEFGDQEDEVELEEEEEIITEEEDITREAEKKGSTEGASISEEVIDDTKDKLIAELKEQNGELKETVKQLQKELRESHEDRFFKMTESSGSSSRKQFMHDLIEKYQKENEVMKQLLEAKNKESETTKSVKAAEEESSHGRCNDKLMKALYKQNSLLLEEMNGLKSLVELTFTKSDKYPYVMELIDTLLNQTQGLRDRYLAHTESSHPQKKSSHHKKSHHSEKKHHKKEKHHDRHHKKHEEKSEKTAHKSHKKKETHKIKQTPTYFIPGPPPPVPQYPIEEMRVDPPKHNYVDERAFPYPIQPLRWLQFHPLPEDNTCLCIRRITAPPTKSIKRFECKDDREFEPYEYQNEHGICHRQKEKVPNVSYPFNQMCPRKLPWDDQKYPLVEVKPNKTKREPLKLSCRYCETLILKNARVVTPNDGLQSVEKDSHHFEVVSFWVNSAVGFGKRVSDVIKFGFSERFLEMERQKRKMVLVLYPCADPRVYSHIPLPQTVIVHRFVTKFEPPRPTAFLLCAVDLGKQAIDRDTNLLPTETTIRKLQKEGFNSLWYSRNGVESILVCNSENLVPLYGIFMEAKIRE